MIGAGWLIYAGVYGAFAVTDSAAMLVMVMTAAVAAQRSAPSTDAGKLIGTWTGTWDGGGGSGRGSGSGSGRGSGRAGTGSGIDARGSGGCGSGRGRSRRRRRTTGERGDGEEENGSHRYARLLRSRTTRPPQPTAAETSHGA